MKTNQVIAEGIVGVSAQLSIPEMIAVADIKSVLDKVLSDNLRKDSESTEVSRAMEKGRDKYLRSQVYISVETIEMIAVFMSKFCKDIPSIDEAIKSVFTIEEQEV